MSFEQFQHTIAAQLDDVHGFRDLTGINGEHVLIYSAFSAHPAFGRFEIRTCRATLHHWNAWIERAQLGTRGIRIVGAANMGILLASFIPVLRSHMT